MTDTDPTLVRALKRTVLTVALLNLGYMVVEMAVALAVGSVSPSRPTRSLWWSLPAARWR